VVDLAIALPESRVLTPRKDPTILKGTPANARKENRVNTPRKKRIIRKATPTSVQKETPAIDQNAIPLATPEMEGQGNVRKETRKIDRKETPLATPEMEGLENVQKETRRIGQKETPPDIPGMAAQANARNADQEKDHLAVNRMTGLPEIRVSVRIGTWGMDQNADPTIGLNPNPKTAPKYNRVCPTKARKQKIRARIRTKTSRSFTLATSTSSVTISNGW
jgi:hypothetical protein